MKYLEEYEIEQLFSDNNIDKIIKEHTKSELIQMFKTIFGSNPISSFNKNRIAEEIRMHYYSLERAKTLLNK